MIQVFNPTWWIKKVHISRFNSKSFNNFQLCTPSENLSKNGSKVPELQHAVLHHGPDNVARHQPLEDHDLSVNSDLLEN